MNPSIDLAGKNSNQMQQSNSDHLGFGANVLASIQTANLCFFVGADQLEQFVVILRVEIHETTKKCNARRIARRNMSQSNMNIALPNFGIVGSIVRSGLALHFSLTSFRNE
jgi:hypothetical protein